MFTKNDLKWFGIAAIMLAAGFFCMALDPADNGFGVLTLYVAPLLILGGFATAIPGLTGDKLRFTSLHAMRREPWKFAVAGAIFFCSLTMYAITLEPTASLWDCSEFIASAYKLQVPHTPGNPLLLLIGRTFSMLSMGDVKSVALCINAMSAVFSSLTVVLIYFIILHLGKRLKAQDPSPTAVISAAAGSLCLAFSDTFWFSAVEAETYAASCFFFFLIVLLILKGTQFEGPVRSRLQILLFYLAGLSFCIHPMCVLAIPVLPVIWHLQHRKLTITNIVVALVIGISIVLFINRVIAIGIFEAAFGIDRILVNRFHFPFYSGAILLLALLAWGFRFILTKFPLYRTHAYSLIFLLAGFLPYLMLFIRSNHNPPIDESNPENLQLIKAYMNREGYPTRPLLFGPYFDAAVVSVTSRNPVYHKTEDGYKLSGHISEYKYQSGRQTILPRLYSQDADHIASYRLWTGLAEDERPGFLDNMTFLLRYQLGHMYFRYLMFNFSGRDSDEQNSAWLVPWSSSDNDSQYGSRAHNQYWMLPLVLGLVGSIFQLKRDPKGFAGVLFAFLITGALLVVYLNSTPNEPRERDYIYVGSYGAFAIWIGLGFMWITDRLRYLAPLALVIPVLMAFENFDDHDRSQRTFQVDNARNILTSCAPDSILFTGGDNDTFPFWYVQEVEGFRTDVRVVVLSYLNTDWYINQLRKQYYDSEPFRFTLTEDDYRQYGPNDALFVRDQLKQSVDASKFLTLLHQRHPALKIETTDGDFYHSLPSKQLLIPAHTSVRERDTPPVAVNVTGNYLYKNTLAILDILLNNPERPMYFNFTSMQQTGLTLENHLVQEGSLFRLRPGTSEEVNTALTFQHLIETANYENLLNDEVYFSHEDHELRIIHPLRQSLNSLARQLVEQGNTDKAVETMRVALKYFYRPRFKPSFANLQAANILVALGLKTEAQRIVQDLYAYNDYRINHGNAGEMEQQLRHFAGEMLSELAE